MATVHAQVATSHEAASITEQEDGCPAVLLRAGETAKHVFLWPLITAVGEVNEQLLYHRSDNVARRDGVDTNVVLPPLGGEIASELDDSSFAGIVGWANKTLERFD